jgi:hypothetical protein
MKKRTAVVLIHFEINNKLAMNKELDELRFSKLKELIFEHPIYDTGMFIISENLKTHHSPRMLQLKHEVDNEMPQSYWHELDDNVKSIEDIKKEAAKAGYEIGNVIIAGQNLAGCVLRSLDYSAFKWANQGHNAQIVLSMCGDYEISGIGPLKYMNSFSSLYSQVKKSGMIDKIDIVSDIDNIKFDE